MKRVLVYIMLLSLTFGLAACGNGNKQQNNQSTQQSSTQTQSSTQPTQSESQTETQGNAYGGSDLQALRTAVVDALGENYWPNMQIDAQVLVDMYGVTEDMYDDFVGEMPMISTNVDTLLIVKAKEGQVGAVEDALNAYRDNMVNSTTQYPINLGKIQASRIETFGNYVCFVQLGADVSDAMDQGEDIAITQCQEENEKALDAIRNTVQSE